MEQEPTSPGDSGDSDDELLEIFLEESREHLDGIEGDLLEIERRGADVDAEVVNKAFRAVHSVKGAAGFFGLNAIKDLAHALENVLGAIRSLQLVPTSEIISGLLDGADALVALLDDPQGATADDIAPHVARLETLNTLDATSVMPPSVAEPPSAASGAAQPDPVEPSSAPAEEPPQVVEAPAKAAVQPPPTPAEHSPKASSNGAAAPPRRDRSLRVNIGLLDSLMSLAGELVLARNQLVQSVGDDPKQTEKTSQRIDQITTELQDAIMATRMQPLELVFTKFNRIVRDLARSLGKQINLVIEGGEVELDKSIVEAIGDPLTHLVRNAADHGIEAPDTRTAAGKCPAGLLRLAAAHRGGQVVIEIEDDGKGIDPEAIRRKAAAQGMMPPEQLASMSAAALTRLIFAPGFSTAEKVTDVSGRGVGMDVVHSNITKLGGTIDIDSTPGRGTRLSIRLPLTLSILPCLLLRERNQPFAVPQSHLVELQRVRPAEVQQRIEWLGDAAVLRSRGELLPLVRLCDVLSMPADEDARANIADRRSPRRGESASLSAPEDDRRKGKERRGRQSALNIAVVSAGDFSYGLIVDTLEDSAEVVIKPLGHHLRDCHAFAGATILGDGHPALILDVPNIGRRLRLHDTPTVKPDNDEDSRMGDQQTLLLVENAPGERFAVPLGVVERIERVEEDRIVELAGSRTMPYRGGSLLLFSIEDVVRVTPRPPQQRPYVVVFRVAGREAGLLVSRLVDALDVEGEIDQLAHTQPGVFGSLVMDDRLLLLLDLQGLAAASMPELANRRETAQHVESASQRILVVDDSPFFLQTISSFVEDLGHETLRATDGDDALELLDENPDTALVLTDIEMPRLDGYELTRAIRKNPRFSQLPVIAMTSLMGEAAERRGFEAGVDEYLGKLDRDLLLERCRLFLERGRSVRREYER
ncbi:MAG: hybrid sensor histidine kinase/response regulator [Proteobacteria bacterium]|nr:MAG: hybrid sensor histidine kinase/response regulator [Pseudomonadota bacterium]PIE17448.1 MAG: hybrid sensor histidine kinase/response regulator [Pseudomonadota bacterium]